MGTGVGTATGCGFGAAGRLIRTTGAGAAGAVGGGVGGAAGKLIRTSGAVGVGALTLSCGGGGAVGLAFARLGGGGAISVAGAVRVGGGGVTVGDTDNATGSVTFPNCCRTASFNRAERSTPHSGHAKVTGLRTISGEASNAYLLPQSHWIFIRRQGLGFNNTTFVLNGKASAEIGGDDFMPPSQNKKLPPYL